MPAKTDNSTPALDAHPDEATILAWEAQRLHLAEITEQAIDEDEVARLCDEGDVFDNLIRATGCFSLPVALAKLRCVRDGMHGIDHYDLTPARAVLDQVIAFLEAK